MPRRNLSVRACLAIITLGLAACGPVASGEPPTGNDDDDDDNNTGCPTGFGDCDGDTGNGCETDLNSPSNCGQCGTACEAVNGTAVCTSGFCEITCTSGYYNCDQSAANGCEATLDTDQNCGACFNSCSGPNSSGTCVNGSCQLNCQPGFGDCNDDPTDGCESDLTASTSCGACDNGCAGNCVAGECEVCDSSLSMASNDPMDAARAIGLCADVASARWLLPDGTTPSGSTTNFDIGHGILPRFGQQVTPREGNSLLALSSGTARQPGDPGFSLLVGYDKGYTSGHPAGFPKESPACPGVVTGEAHDGIALEVTLTVPDWAEGFSFDFDFYTYEYPGYICDRFNDFFVALLDPIPADQTDGNISFDAMGNPVSVNNGFLEACGCIAGPPCTAGGKTFTCALGTGPLQGTGFEKDGLFETGAATGWLTTRAPAEPGSQITIRLISYDSGDGVLDSTTIVDNFRWLPSAPEVGTEPID